MNNDIGLGVRRTRTFALVTAVVALVQACQPAPIPEPTSTYANTITPTRTSSPTPTATTTPSPTTTYTPSPTATPYVPKAFYVGARTFEFLGVFLPGWYWGSWTSEADVELVRTAKAAGITVIYAMPPMVEPALGVFLDSEFVKLDHLVQIAGQEGLYVMPSVLHASATMQLEGFPYHDPFGIQGLVKNEDLRGAYRDRVRWFVERTNILTGISYKDDPTILAWIVIEEPLAPPFAYPGGALPDVTVGELGDWIDEMVLVVKSVDPDGLVTVQTGAMIDQFEDYEVVFQSESLDFIILEDADARVLGTAGLTNEVYGRLASVGKPMVVYLSFTSGALDQEAICQDYGWQATTLGGSVRAYHDLQARGYVVFSWGVDSMPVPGFDRCYRYTASNEQIVGALREIDAWIGDRNDTEVPLEQVRLQ